MIKSKKTKRGPVLAKKVTYDGILFASGLEKYMYSQLKKYNIQAKYEGETFVIFEGFVFNTSCHERQSNGNGSYDQRGFKKVLPITYTPDFIAEDFIIECKGRANESFPIRWKMFKKWISIERPNVALYKPQNQKECDTTIALILEGRSKSQGINTKKEK